MEIKNQGFKNKKQESVKKENEINKIFKEGKSVKGKFYICRYINNDFNYSRFCIVVNKRIGNAVARNYEKRILREFFRQSRSVITNHIDLVIIVIYKIGTVQEKKKTF
jgi:ribonuclease P protein component